MEAKSLLLILLSVFATAIARPHDCVYTIYVRTGSKLTGGTDSKISLDLFDRFGGVAVMRDLESWGGLMGPTHDYFERGNLDIFRGRGPCLATAVCAIKLTSDGSGPRPGWFCNSLRVTTIGSHSSCSQILFTVKQWLTLVAPPFQLIAIRNYCGYDDAVSRPHGSS